MFGDFGGAAAAIASALAAAASLTAVPEPFTIDGECVEITPPKLLDAPTESADEPA